MSKTLTMRFTLANGKTSAMSVPEPKDDLERDDVEPVMQTVVDNQVILVNQAVPAAIKAAVIREVNETKLI